MEEYKEFESIISDITSNETVQKMKKFRQHYNTSCFEHCKNVAFYSYLICKKLEKPPYVCNGCPSRKGCRKHKYFYRAKDAQEEYEYDLRDSRVGINMNIQEFKNLNKIVTTEIKNGHSFSMICMNHKDEFPVKKRSLYNYLEKGYLDIANIDLTRKVRYKKRTKHNDVTIRNTKIRENST